MNGSIIKQFNLQFLLVFALLLGGSGLAYAQGGPATGPVEELLAQIAILNDKIDALQEDVDNLATASGDHPTLRWDQKLPAADRFDVPGTFNNEAVLDRETGLVWERTPTDFGTWFIARSTCVKKKVGGRMGWRLPSLVELLSLIDPNTPDHPRLPTGHPFLNIQSEVYWSATTSAENPLTAWMVDLTGSTTVFDPQNKNQDGELFWCVRGGMNADQY